MTSGTTDPRKFIRRGEEGVRVSDLRPSDNQTTISATISGTVELFPALQCCFQRFEPKIALNNIEEGKGDR